ncbi:low temperature requirement protein A [Plantactinospora sonchi]|uniref:Low temperature requirement protein A n=1 Tax=Plantactinospora sonchi TaxID=1544735 RepID=A0ABU7S578_9ACTN
MPGYRERPTPADTSATIPVEVRLTRHGVRSDPLRREQDRPVTSIELFFDVVYVLAVTQLTELLLGRLTPVGTAQAGLLLLAVWWAWVDTAWITNWFDPDRNRIRLMLIVLAGVSLVMSSAIPEAYGDRGLWFAGAYVVLEVGRSLFVVSTLPGQPALRRNLQRLLTWRAVSAPLWLAGGVVSGSTRTALWAAAVFLDTTSAACGFYVPGWGRSLASEWAISGAHLAERARLFIIIALGESILVTGSTLQHARPDPATLIALAANFLGTVGLWWIYFDRSAGAAQAAIAASEEPGRLGRSAYTYLHIPMVAGIILTAVGDELTITHPTGTTHSPVVFGVLAGPALFLVGFFLFKRLVLEVRALPYLVAVVVLVGLAPLGPLLEPVVLSVLASLVVVATAAVSSVVAARAAGSHAQG